VEVDTACTCILFFGGGVFISVRGTAFKVTISFNTVGYKCNLNEVIQLCIDSIYSLFYIYFRQHNYIIKA